MMKFISPKLLLLVTLVVTATGASSQYLHRQGKDIVDAQNNPVILRGMGLGGWMLQEGYMLETNSFANPQHEIRAKIVDLVGESNAQIFYDAWHKNHCTRKDIDSLAAWGFNSVRLPMHYNLFTLPIQSEPVPGQNTWLDKGFVMVDSLLKWCAANHMYLILDLHAAPGGQGNDAAISDYDVTKPSLWQSDANKQKTIALWRKLADRYKNEPWIGGYDLINETNWNFEGTNKNGCDEQNNAPLKQLFNQITAAIREVDTNHIIYIEGNCWANNHNGLLPFTDNNTVLSFHKYWNNNDLGSLQDVINKRNQNNVPLWLGETGENSNSWFTSAIKILEANNIGWAWWPMKKVNSIVNPLTVVKNQGYENLLNYWKNGGAKPSSADAMAALMQLTENLKIENNIFRPDVIDAMFRQPYSSSTKPFKKHKAPGVVHASDFDLGRLGKAYYDVDTGTYHVSIGGGYTAWNAGWTYRNDGVDLQTNTDPDPLSNGYNIGWTKKGEWTQYTIHVDSTAGYNVGIRYSSNGATILRLMIDGKDLTQPINLVSSGGYGTWKTHTLQDVVLRKGSHTMRLWIEKEGMNLSFVSFTLSKKVSEVPLKKVGALTDPQGTTIKLMLSKEAQESTITPDGFSLTINNADIEIISATPGTDDAELILTPRHQIYYGDAAYLSYNGTAITSTDGFVLETFADYPIFNTIPFHHSLPGQVQAEDFFFNAGLQTEPTTDVGGGLNIGYTDKDDYLEYLILVPDSGNYKIDARVASLNTGGAMELQQLSQSRTLLNSKTLTFTASGGWQTWKTASTQMTLDDGASILKVIVTQPSFNLNWFRFIANIVTDVEVTPQQEIVLFPNPTAGPVTVTTKDINRRYQTIIIRDLLGRVVREFDRVTERVMELDISALPRGTYTVEIITDNGRTNSRLVKYP